MQQEIEVKFLNVDHDQVRARLRAAGGVCEQPSRQMRRAIIDYPDRRLQISTDKGWGWVRVRDEGDKVTCTYKHISADEADTTHEIEFVVSSYEQAVALFEAIGLQIHSEQETRRETWRLGAVNVELDEWPWIPPYIEIEGPSQDEIKSAAQQLGFDWKLAETGSSDKVYRVYYPRMTDEESVSDIQYLTFGGGLPDWLKERQ